MLNLASTLEGQRQQLAHPERRGLRRPRSSHGRLDAANNRMTTCSYTERAYNPSDPSSRCPAPTSAVRDVYYGSQGRRRGSRPDERAAQGAGASHTDESSARRTSASRAAPAPTTWREEGPRRFDQAPTAPFFPITQPHSKRVPCRPPPPSSMSVPSPRPTPPSSYTSHAGTPKRSRAHHANMVLKSAITCNRMWERSRVEDEVHWSPLPCSTRSVQTVQLNSGSGPGRHLVLAAQVHTRPPRWTPWKARAVTFFAGGPRFVLGPGGARTPPMSRHSPAKKTTADRRLRAAAQRCPWEIHANNQAGLRRPSKSRRLRHVRNPSDNHVQPPRPPRVKQGRSASRVRGRTVHLVGQGLAGSPAGKSGCDSRIRRATT